MANSLAISENRYQIREIGYFPDQTDEFFVENLSSDDGVGVYDDLIVRESIPVDRAILRKFSLILQDPQDERYGSRLRMRSAKLAATIICFASQYPSMEAARQVSDNVVLKNLLGAGEVVAWGAVYSVASSELIESILIERELRVLDRNSGCLCNTVYWTSITALSLAVQTSDVYISYVYTNESLFWPIYVGGVYAAFTLDSLNRAIEKSARTDNILTRFLYRNTEKCKIFRAKENFCSLLEDYFTDYLKEASSEQRQLFFDMLQGEVSDAQHARNFLFMLAKGLEKRAWKIRTENVCLKRGGKLVKLSGPLLYLANYYLDGKIIYKSSHLILDNAYFAAFLIFISTTPNIYLDLDMSTNTVDKVFWGIARHINNLIKGRWGSYFNKGSILRGVGNVFTGFMTCAGLGSTVTIIDDTIGFEENKIISVAILGFTALLVADGVSDLSDKTIDYLFYLTSSLEEQELVTKIDRINILVKNMKLMSAEQFQAFITNIQEAIEYEPTLIDDLANDAEYEGFRRKILDHLGLNLGNDDFEEMNEII